MTEDGTFAQSCHQPVRPLAFLLNVRNETTISTRVTRPEDLDKSYVDYVGSSDRYKPGLSLATGA
jgi:hypothetical protein